MSQENTDDEDHYGTVDHEDITTDAGMSPRTRACRVKLWGGRFTTFVAHAPGT